MSNEIYIAKQETLLETKTKVETVQNTLVETETKVEAVQNKLSETETKVEAVQNTLGKTNDSGGTTTTGTVAAKENAILTEVNKIGNIADTGATETAGTVMGKLNTILGRLSIKSVQQGNVSIGYYETKKEVPISTVNLGKSFLLLLPLSVSKGTVNSVVLQSEGILFSTTSGADKPGYYWQVIELH